MYRSKQENIPNNTAGSWYQKLGYQAAAVIPAPSRAELCQILTKRFKHHKLKVKFVERAGPSVVKSLQKSNPSPPASCDRTDCMLCHQGPSNLACYRPNKGYRMVCNRLPCNIDIDMGKQGLKSIGILGSSFPGRTNFDRKVGFL